MGFDGLSAQAHRRQAVIDTSAKAYRDEAVTVEYRERMVLAWLQAFGVESDPTSGELAEAVKGFPAMARLDFTAVKQFVRRGLSGLKALGKVSHQEARVCRVTKKTCVTWRATE